MLKSALLLPMVSCLQLSATQCIGLCVVLKKKEKKKGGTDSKWQKKRVISVPLVTLDQANSAACDYSLKYKCLKNRNINRF